MNFYKTLQQIISSDKPSEKFEKFKTFYVDYQAGNTVFEKEFIPISFTQPSYSSFCKVVYNGLKI